MYTIPKIMAAGVLIMARGGSLRTDKRELMTPFFSKSVCHAIVRRRKFIHMGRIKMNTTKLLLPIWCCLKIRASG